MAVEGIQAANANAAMVGAKPKVVDAGEYNIVTTSKGDVVKVPGRFIGATTTVKPLDDGKYEITSKGSKLGAEPKTTILTEEELVAKYGEEAGKKLQVVA